MMVTGSQMDWSLLNAADEVEWAALAAMGEIDVLDLEPGAEEPKNAHAVASIDVIEETRPTLVPPFDDGVGLATDGDLGPRSVAHKPVVVMESRRGQRRTNGHGDRPLDFDVRMARNE